MIAGRQGRAVVVSKADVEAANVLLNGAPATAGAMATGFLNDNDLPDSEDMQMSGMRQTIGARLQASKRNAPHFRVAVDVVLDKLLALRKQINDENPSVKVSVNDFVIKAAAMTLVKESDLNVQFDQDTGVIRTFKNAHISVAVAMESGFDYTYCYRRE